MTILLNNEFGFNVVIRDITLISLFLSGSTYLFRIISLVKNVKNELNTLKEVNSIVRENPVREVSIGQMNIISYGSIGLRI